MARDTHMHPPVVTRHFQTDARAHFTALEPGQMRPLAWPVVIHPGSETRGRVTTHHKHIGSRFSVPRVDDMQIVDGKLDAGGRFSQETSVPDAPPRQEDAAQRLARQFVRG